MAELSPKEFILRFDFEYSSVELPDGKQHESVAVHGRETGELIRCGKCRFGYPYGDGTVIACLDPNYMYSRSHSADWYCADGKRKEDKA